MSFLNTFITEKDSASDRSHNYVIDLALYKSITTRDTADPNLETGKIQLLLLVMRRLHS